MQTTIEKLKEFRVRTTTIVTAEEQKKAEEQALTSLASRVKIKGFREGMAPTNVVRQHVTSEQINEELVRSILPQVMADALKVSGAKPILRPAASITSLEPLTIALIFVERPTATLKKPDAIKIEKKSIADASKEEIETFIQKLLQHDRTETSVERAATTGDSVKMSLATKDQAGNTMEELTMGRYSVLIGSEELIPELEKHLLGMKKGEKKTVGIDFPKTHDLPALQGKHLSVTIAVSDVAETKLPALTGEYIASRMGADRTPEAFRIEVGQMLTNQKKNQERKRREEDLYTHVRAATSIELAPELIDAEVQEMLLDLQERLKKQDMTMEKWLESTGKKPEHVIEEMKGIAHDRITLRFGMQKLAEHKKIEPDAEELKLAIERERTHAKEHGHDCKEEDLQAGGGVYERIVWELKMHTLVEWYCGDARTQKVA